jgi:hypothetical protein
MSKRLVTLGDSFTEGVGDDDPAAPNGVRGWADRVAEQLAAREPDFRYANLAIRGKLLPQILGEQLEPALAMAPDLVVGELIPVIIGVARAAEYAGPDATLRDRAVAILFDGLRRSAGERR